MVFNEYVRGWERLGSKASTGNINKKEGTEEGQRIG